MTRTLLSRLCWPVTFSPPFPAYRRILNPSPESSTIMAATACRGASMHPPHRVVILGGGFGGMIAAQALKRAPVEVTLIDRRNFHLFQPLLYQVATGGLSPGEIASPLRYVLRRNKNTEVLLAEVTDLDAANRRV